jgi:hypothetical protein
MSLEVDHLLVKPITYPAAEVSGHGLRAQIQSNKDIHSVCFHEISPSVLSWARGQGSSVFDR